MGKETNVLKSLEESSVSRRSFLKGTAALGAMAAMYGCSKDSGSEIIYGGGDSNTSSPEAPVIDETVFAGSSPHNCGGGCVLKAYVKDGVIKRFATDETPEKTYVDGTGDYMQDRACPRCRSQRSWIYNSNRLMYPMIQKGERGNLDTFERVTWEEAANYIKEKADAVMEKYGPAAFHSIYASGMGGGYSPQSDLFKMIGAPSLAMTRTHDDYSFPQWELITRCMHDANSQPRSNDFQDVYNADELIVWGYNLSEMLNQQQINFTFAQIKEIKDRGKGAAIPGGKTATVSNLEKITVIDPKYTNTAILGADEFLAPIQGTDTAMICGMIHYILTEKKAELGKMYAAHAKLTGEQRTALESGSVDSAEFNNALRQAVGQYVYGFFDTDDTNDAAAGTNESYTQKGRDAERFKTAAKVTPGASFSAYVFGNSTALVTAHLNKAASIYPDTIGYNVRSYGLEDGGEADPLYGKTTKCYGQVVKTPEWAEKICGVPAAQIKALADTFLTKNVHCWMMGGLQRNSEGDQACWAWTVLMNFLLCFGKAGRSHGRADGRGNDRIPSFKSGWSTNINDERDAEALKGKFNYLTSNSSGKTVFKDALGEMSLLTFPNNYNSNHSSDTISVFQWLDACEIGKYGKIDEKVYIPTADGSSFTEETRSVYKARWNDGQVKRLPAPVKFVFSCGGNIPINQNGDCNLAAEVWKAKDAEGNYVVSFLGVIDVNMTSSAQYADVVLPGSISFERYQSGNSARSPLRFLTTKAINPPGDALVEMEIGAVLAKAFGQEEGYYNGYTPRDIANDKTQRGVFEKEAWNKTIELNKATFGMDAKDWQAAGFYKPDQDLSKLDNYIAYEQFLKNPGKDNVVTAVNKANNAVKTAFRTLSGRVEAYCLPMMENYEMRMGNNIDSSIDLVNGGTLYTKIAKARKLEGKGRFCYPIPMYIPLIEGCHANQTAEPHPDPLGLIDKGYDCNLLTWHTIYRSHSTFNSSAFVNEVEFYKRDKNGNPTHIRRSLTNANAGANIDNTVTEADKKAQQVWTDDVYETIWLNPATASTKGIAEGDVIIVESLRGKIAGSAHLSERVRPGTISMTQGSWYAPIENWTAPSGNTYDKVDVGGNANTLFGLRPCRIAGGMSLASECRVNVYKA